jgi:hypothetical protein
MDGQIDDAGGDANRHQQRGRDVRVCTLTERTQRFQFAGQYRYGRVSFRFRKSVITDQAEAEALRRIGDFSPM